MIKPCSITIDCRLQIHYASYYLIGFERLGVSFSYGIIEDLPIRNKSQLWRGLAFLVQTSSSEIKKVFIDTYDHDSIDANYYEWADIYGKVNLKKTDLSLKKVVSVGPNFGVRIGGYIYTIGLGIKNYFRARDYYTQETKPSFVEFMHGYLYSLYRRTNIDVYEKDYIEDKDYIFTMNTLWYDKDTDATTNTLRGCFALQCKKVMKYFEGGFFYIDSKNVLEEFPAYTNYLEKYRDIITKKRVSLKKYIQKTKRSVFVFNTPAVCGCHGWKLGEYLAMGKAIISTPINHEMPDEFSKDVHYILVNNEDEITEAVDMLCKNENKRAILKSNTKKYYFKNIAPQAVVERILSMC